MQLKPKQQCPSYLQYLQANDEWQALIKLHEELGEQRKKAMAKFQTLSKILELERVL